MVTLDAIRARIPLDVRHRIAQLRVAARVPTGRWRVLPDVLVIGAQRGGTSTLYRHLGRHPDVVPSIRKEVEYFSRRHDRGEQWYRAHFGLDWARSRVGFEATPDYLFHPLAAGRAASLLPDARIVVLLREPVARAWSHYHHMVGLGHEPLDFDTAISAEDARCAPDLARLADNPHYDARALLRYSYVARGRYAEQLTRWLAVYPRERVLVIRSEDFFADPSSSFERVLGFVGLASWSPPNGFVNVSRQAGAKLPPVPAELRERLVSVFAEPNRAIESLLGITWD